MVSAGDHFVCIPAGAVPGGSTSSADNLQEALQPFADVVLEHLGINLPQSLASSQPSPYLLSAGQNSSARGRRNGAKAGIGKSSDAPEEATVSSSNSSSSGGKGRGRGAKRAASRALMEAHTAAFSAALDLELQEEWAEAEQRLKVTQRPTTTCLSPCMQRHTHSHGCDPTLQWLRDGY